MSAERDERPLSLWVAGARMAPPKVLHEWEHGGRRFRLVEDEMGHPWAQRREPDTDAVAHGWELDSYGGVGHELLRQLRNADQLRAEIAARQELIDRAEELAHLYHQTGNPTTADNLAAVVIKIANALVEE